MAKNGSKTASDSLFFIPCRVEPGMFREEYLVRIEAADARSPGKPVLAQLLVDQREVANLRGTPKRNDPAQAWLRVTLVGSSGDGDTVVLPQPSQPLGETVLVKRGIAKREPTL